MMAADAIAALIAGVIALEVRSGGQPRAASYVWFTFGLPVLWVACVALARGTSRGSSAPAPMNSGA